jgi:hypothetical protein
MNSHPYYAAIRKLVLASIYGFKWATMLARNQVKEENDARHGAKLME